MKGDKKFKASSLYEGAGASPKVPWMPKGKLKSHELQLKDLARARAAKKGS